MNILKILPCINMHMLEHEYLWTSAVSKHSFFFSDPIAGTLLSLMCG